MLRHVALVALVALLGCGQAAAPADLAVRDATPVITHAVDAFVAAARTPAAYRALSTELVALRERDPAASDEVERRLVSLALFPIMQHADTSPDAQVQALALTVWPAFLSPADGPRAAEDGGTYLERLCRDDQALGCATVVPEYRAQIVWATVADRAFARAKHAIAACDDCAHDPAWQEVRRGWEGVARTAVASIDHRSRVEAWPIAGDGSHVEPRAPAVEIEVGATGELSFDGYSYDSAFRQPMLRDVKHRGTVAFYMAPDAPLRQLAELLRDAHAAGFSTVTLLARASAYPWARRAYTLSTSQATLPGLERPIQAFLTTVDAKAATVMAVRTCVVPDARSGSPASC